MRWAPALLAALALASAALALAPPRAWLAATWLGGSPAYMLLAPALFHILGAARGSRLVAALALASGLAAGLKYALGLPRPPEELWLAEAEGPGFPSGHATVAAAFWLTLALTAPSPSTVALAAAIPALVAGSRLALRVHYPHDAAGGVLLGLLAAVAVAVASRKLAPSTLLALAGLAGLALQAPAGTPEPEAPLAALGAAAAAAILRERLHPRPLRHAVLGSMAALALGAPALVVSSPLKEALMALAGAAAVAAPLLAERAYTAGQTVIPLCYWRFDTHSLYSLFICMKLRICIDAT